VEFSTGVHSTNYHLDSIQLAMTQASGAPSGFSVMIYTDGGVGSPRPGSSLGSLSGSLPDLRAEQTQLSDLHTQVERHAQVRFGVFRPSYLPALAAMAGPARFRCSVIRKECSVVGFSLVLKDGDTAVAHVVGFDYEANELAPVYLRLLHRVIEDGLSLGCRVIHFGRTALEPKARLGALPTDTEVWVKHSHPVINCVVGPLIRLVPQDNAPHREPFGAGRSGNDVEHSQDSELPKSSLGHRFH
jgi:hypothetical protein